MSEPNVNNNTSGSSSGMAGMSALSSMLGAWSVYQQGKMQKAQYSTAAQIAEINARIAEMQARDALKRGHEAEGRSRQTFKKLRGSQRATLAAQGIRVDVGSAQDIQQEAADIGEFEALTIRNNAAREAFGYRSQGIGFQMQATGAEAAGRLAASQGRIAATQTLMTGGLQAASYYQQGK